MRTFKSSNKLDVTLLRVVNDVFVLRFNRFDTSNTSITYKDYAEFVVSNDDGYGPLTVVLSRNDVNTLLDKVRNRAYSGNRDIRSFFVALLCES